jgi:hypothetical protein
VKWRSVVAALVFTGVTIAPGTVMAQTVTAIVVTEAPVYLFPNTQRTPLATLPVNTALRVLAEEGDWVRVEFPDARFGPRVGYVERKRVRLTRIQEPLNPPTERQRQPPPPDQTRPEPKAAQARSTRVGARAYGTYSATRFAASDTLEAVGSDSIQGNFGAGGTVTGLWRELFLDVGYSQIEMDGQRVFVDDEMTVFPLGIPLQVKVQSLDFAGGWRVTTGRLSSYVGGGVTLTSYKETSAFSDSGDDVDEQKPGPMLLAGVDAALLKWVHVGGELRYRFVKGILGEDGVSEAFGEDDAGGLAVGVRVSFGR